MHPWVGIASMLCVSLVLSAPSVSGQTGSRLTGTVMDAGGAVVPGADLVLRNVATGLEYHRVSDDTGVYVFPDLPPGEYELTCQLSGFKTFGRRGLVMETGITRTVDVALEVGEMEDTVEVVASTPLLEAGTSTVGQLIDRARVRNMPLESRRSAQLVRLAGAVIYNQDGAAELPLFSMAGGRGRKQMWNMDGMAVQNVTIGDSLLSLNPPSEAIQEFKVEQNNYSAEFGHAAGGVINMTTRSGTNAFHGAGYEFFRNDALDATNFFAEDKPPLRFNVFGMSIGGPIRRNRAFFFFNYEGSRRRTGVTRTGLEVPNPPEVDGDFSRRTDLTVLDPLTGEPFPNNIIPPDRIDPVGQAVARLYPAPTRNVDLTRAPSNNFQGNVTQSDPQDIYTGRVDMTLSDHDRFFVRFSRIRGSTEIPGVFPNEFADPFALSREPRNLSVMGTWNHEFSPTVLHEFSANFDRRDNVVRGGGTGSGQNGALGIQGADPDLFARIDIAGLTRLGQTNHARDQTPIRGVQVADHLTWLRGRHQIKIGAQFRSSLNQDLVRQRAGGQFTFGNRATGDGLAALLLGWTTAASLTDVTPLETRSDYYAAFIQDDWKVTPRLTLNLGLRWEMDQPRWDRNNRQSGFDLEAINPVCNCPGVVTFAGLDGASRFAHDYDTNNFGPRLGFAWQATQRLVVRGGYGISYYSAYGSGVTPFLVQGFGGNASLSSPDGGFTPVFLFQDGLPVIEGEELGPGFGAVPIGETPRLSPDFIEPDHNNGYAQTWNLTLQRQIARDMAVEISYLANVGHRLGTNNLDLNEISLVDGRGPAQQDQLLRPFPQFDRVLQRVPAVGNSSYHAMNVKLEKRYSQGLNLLLNYTWSKYLDDVMQVGLGAEQGNAGSFTHRDLRHLDKSYSGNHVPHRFIGSGVYELPFGRGRHWEIENGVVNALAGGWGVGFIAEFRAGAPFTVTEQTNRTNTFSRLQRPNLLHDPMLPTNRSRAETIAEYFDTSAFEAPGEGVFGDAPRTICCGPGDAVVDLSVTKEWNVGGDATVQFRAEAFNVFNTVNLGNPAAVRGRADFGQIISAGAPRQMQLGLRVEF